MSEQNNSQDVQSSTSIDPSNASNTASVAAPSGAPGAQAEQQVKPLTAKPAQAVLISSDTMQRLEHLLQSFLQEKKSARRWRIFFRLIAFVFVAWVLWMLFFSPSLMGGGVPIGEHTAVVQLHGEIAADMPASAEYLIPALEEAFENKDAKAVIIHIDSPGGSPVQAGMLNDEIHRLKAMYKKPVYAVVGETCASAAYYVAVAADKIYVDKASLVGSIGVLMDGFGATELMQKLGVERRLMTAGENKGILDPFSPVSEAQRQHVQSMLDEIHQQFIQTVKAGRGSRLKETPEIFSGLFWTGEKSIKLGLSDHLGSLDFVAREVVQVSDIVDYTPQQDLTERLSRSLGASIGQGVMQSLKMMPHVR